MNTFIDTLLKTIDDIIILIDEDMNIAKVNNRGLNLLGYSDGELHHKPVSSIITTDCAEYFQLHEKSKRDNSMPARATLRAKNGTHIPVVLSMSVVYGEEDACHGAIIKLRNPADEKDQLLQHPDEEYHQLVQKAGLAIVIDNRDGELTFCNKSCLDLFGYNAEEMKKQSLQTLLHPDDLQRVMQYHHNRFTNDQAPSRYECKAVRKDGSTIFLEVDVVKLMKNGTVFGTLSCIWEITQRKRIEEELHRHRKHLEELVAERTHALTRINEQLRSEIKERTHIEEQLQKSLEQSRNILEQTVRALSSTIGMRDPYTADHQERVTRLACSIAHMMDLPDGTINDIRLAGMLHDIGKIAIPVEILSKPTELTETEYSLVKTHPQVGYEILQHIDFPRSVAQIVQQHHERIDGSGYPQGLHNGEILLESRILAVADVVEAMSAQRSNRPGQSIEQTLDYLNEKKGTLFDPPIVDCCRQVFQKKSFSFHHQKMRDA